MELPDFIQNSPGTKTIIGAVIVFVVGFLFLRKALLTLLILTAIVGTALYFYYQAQ